MNLKRLTLSALTIFLPVTLTAAKTVSVDPEKCVIVLPDSPSTKDETAAEELQLHLKLITGVEIPRAVTGSVPNTSFAFHIAIQPSADEEPLAVQESRWTITARAAWFYGDTSGAGTGALFAVYSFLEEQLGVTWIEPGDAGIAFKRRSTLNLKPGKYRWAPELTFRKIRQTYRQRPAEEPVPARFKPFPEFWHGFRDVANQRAVDDVRWQHRMRMGGGRSGGGHAFAKWWDRFGETQPEYFALNKHGKREPVPLPKAHQTNEWIKICPSNPAVAEQIVKDWMPAKDRLKYVNAGLNDGVENFCECEDCRKLDVRLAEEHTDDLISGRYVYPDGRYVHLTDRYAHLANAVAREVRKHRQDAMVSMYAYLTTLHPPRRVKLEPNIVVHIVPYVVPLDRKITEELIEGWRKAGATEIAFRPNYHFKYHPMPLPLGIEKEMFDVFQVAHANGCISADYDSLMGCWPLTGLADYVLARAIAAPDKDFTHWESRYCSAFGDATDDVRAYFRYWRNEVWESRLKPNLGKLTKAGRTGNFARGLAWAIRSNYSNDCRPEGCDQYYTEQDFDRTDEILQQAASRSLTPEERKRVEQLVLINRHSRLEHGAMYYRGNKGYGHSKALLEFRTTHHKDMNISWPGVFYVEDAWGDLCHLYLTEHLEEYPLPWLKTPFKWRFKVDEDNVGLSQKWQAKDWDATADWKTIRVNVPWSNTYESPHVELKKKLKTYDGVGWYTFRFELPHQLRRKKVFLYLGGVDDNCRVYVNGQLAGEHHSVTPADTDTPFEIQIDQFVDWNAEYQIATVRVEDKGGRGGVHKETWIVTK